MRLSILSEAESTRRDFLRTTIGSVVLQNPILKLFSGATLNKHASAILAYQKYVATTGMNEDSFDNLIFWWINAQSSNDPKVSGNNLAYQDEEIVQVPHEDYAQGFYEKHVAVNKEIPLQVMQGYFVSSLSGKSKGDMLLHLLGGDNPQKLNILGNIISDSINSMVKEAGPKEFAKLLYKLGKEHGSSFNFLSMTSQYVPGFNEILGLKPGQGFFNDDVKDTELLYKNGIAPREDVIEAFKTKQARQKHSDEYSKKQAEERKKAQAEEVERKKAYEAEQKANKPEKITPRPDDEIWGSSMHQPMENRHKLRQILEALNRREFLQKTGGGIAATAMPGGNITKLLKPAAAQIAPAAVQFIHGLFDGGFWGYYGTLKEWLDSYAEYQGKGQSIPSPQEVANIIHQVFAGQVSDDVIDNYEAEYAWVLSLPAMLNCEGQSSSRGGTDKDYSSDLIDEYTNGAYTKELQNFVNKHGGKAVCRILWDNNIANEDGYYIENIFPKLRAIAEKVPNFAKLFPMGIDILTKAANDKRIGFRILEKLRVITPEDIHSYYELQKRMRTPTQTLHKAIYGDEKEPESEEPESEEPESTIKPHDPTKNTKWDHRPDNNPFEHKLTKTLKTIFESTPQFASISTWSDGESTAITVIYNGKRYQYLLQNYDQARKIYNYAKKYPGRAAQQLKDLVKTGKAQLKNPNQAPEPTHPTPAPVQKTLPF